MKRNNWPTTPFLRTAVTEVQPNLRGQGCEEHPIHHQGLAAAVAAAGQAKRISAVHQSDRDQLFDSMARNPKVDYVGIFVTDNRAPLVVSSIPQVEYYYGKTSWWQAVMKGGHRSSLM